MFNFFRLKNQIKHYDWGSPEFIPEFLRVQNLKGKPWAEMWMGNHPGAPSLIEIDGEYIPLQKFIKDNPRSFPLQGELPVLLKLLAAEKPLSIQAHPNEIQAREGFEKENNAGISLEKPNRNYKDIKPKPEILCALTPFTVMCGFRKPEEIQELLNTFFLTAPASLKAAFKPLMEILSGKNPLEEFLTALLNLPKDMCDELSLYILNSGGEEKTNDKILAGLWKYIQSFTAEYPGDPAVISPLYLNLFTLGPGQAIFIPAGILHAYIKGLGIELMTSSDNVLRGGLTNKYIDIPELIHILNFDNFMPQILEPPPSPDWYDFPVPSNEISLSLMCANGETREFSGKTPAICIIVNGELHINDVEFKKGESFLITRSGNPGTPCLFKGSYSLFTAS
jgi:mannose-6-phosphate isomerase